jgi:hypothetical protein
MIDPTDIRIQGDKIPDKMIVYRDTSLMT